MMEFVYRAQDTADETAHAIYIFKRVLRSKEVLRPMNLDVNSTIDPRGKAEGVSTLDQTPLYVATHYGNLAAVRWCLRNGARPTKN
jgi:hypothetical protein